MAEYNMQVRYTPGVRTFHPIAGLVPTPVRTWVKNEQTGKSSPTGPQAVDEHGTPLWNGTATIQVDQYGTGTARIVEVIFASKEQPKSIPAEFFGQTA